MFSVFEPEEFIVSRSLQTTHNADLLFVGPVKLFLFTTPALTFGTFTFTTAASFFLVRVGTVMKIRIDAPAPTLGIGGIVVVSSCNDSAHSRRLLSQQFIDYILCHISFLTGIARCHWIVLATTPTTVGFLFTAVQLTKATHGCIGALRIDNGLSGLSTKSMPRSFFTWTTGITAPTPTAAAAAAALSFCILVSTN